MNVGDCITMINRAVPTRPGRQVRVLERGPDRAVVTTMFGEPERRVFTRRVTGEWIEQGLPTAASWGRVLHVTTVKAVA